MTRINVLSLFGGIECGRVALERLGSSIEIGNYYSSEVDNYPAGMASNNFPDIIHIGDVKNVSFSDNCLYWGNIDKEIAHREMRFMTWKIDLLIGGSPCQDLSNAKTGGLGLKGKKSSLFYDYIRLLDQVKPKYFLLENVASMKEGDRDKITEIIGVSPIMIDSNLVSAQNRKRLYWTNIPGVIQPENRGIVIKDILEHIPMDDKTWKPIPEKYLDGMGRVKIKEGTKLGFVLAGPGDIIDINYPNSNTHRGRLMRDKLHTLTANMYKGNIPFLIGVARDRKDERLRISKDQEKLPTLRSVMGTGGNNVPLLIDTDRLYWRPLTPVECERAQTLPDDYTAGFSKSRRLKAIGNGWTVEVIKHILSFAKF